MKSKVGRVLLLAAVALAGPAAMVVTAPPALAANQTITASGGACVPPGTPAWQNANVTINVGDTVTWTNCSSSGNHGLRSYSSGWCLPFDQTAGASGSSWSYPCKFTTPGSYAYWCSVHGSSMSGVVTVQGSAPPPQSTPTPVPTHTQAPPAPATHAPAAQTPSAAPAPSAVPSPVALAPSISPTPALLASPSAAPAVNTTPASSNGGGGSPVAFLLAAAVVVAVLAGGGVYWYRRRPRV